MRDAEMALVMAKLDHDQHAAEVKCVIVASLVIQIAVYYLNHFIKSSTSLADGYSQAPHP
jgi:hypothetical protein